MMWLIEGKHPAIVRAIELALEDPLRDVVNGAIRAAEKTGDARLIGTLRRLADRTSDPRVNRLARVAVRSIEEGQRIPSQLTDLRTELETLRADHRRLLERVERLDAR